MRTEPMSTVFTADSLIQAESIIGWLRTMGLHPAELGLTTPIPFERKESKFPIEVPIEETERAKSAIETRPQFARA